jgi:UDP-glucose 4-epimerase
MRAIVTGTAGFIGSHLAEALVQHGWQVVGIDCFTPFYERARKVQNLRQLQSQAAFSLVECDLVDAPWADLLPGVQVVFHQAAQAGTRSSWGAQFADHLHHNLLATQSLLEGCRHVAQPPRIVYASSSSVYGDAETLPTPETTPPRPVSPYGITKLSAEQLGFVYHRSFGVPVTALRYFTVYGPRQRPDMAFHRFLKALSRGETIDVYGDGAQSRDFTFISDIVTANLQAAVAPGAVGEALNISGGTQVSLYEVLAMMEEVSHRRFERRQLPAQPGDARHTGADISKASRILGYRPAVGLTEGLTTMWDWSEAWER